MQELYNRLVIVIPKVMERVASNDENKPAGTMVDKMTCDVIVLDGGPLHYGGRPEAMPPVPHDKVAQLPYREMGMAVWSFGIISACREAYAKRQQGLPGMIIGRVTVGEQKDVRKSAPWLIRKATDEEKAIGRQYLATVAQDVFA
jgi:hypothetical protein